MSGCPTFNFKNLLHTGGFSDIDSKLIIDGSINCCVYLIYICIILCTIKANMACLTVLIMDLPKYHIFYFIKISKLLTIKGQCRLEDIVINFLPGINQF